MEGIMGCGCLAFIVWIVIIFAQLLGLNALGTVGLIIAVFPVLGIIGNFLEVKETRNKIKDNINQPNKLEPIFDILKKQEQKQFHNFIITQLAEIIDREKINIICQEVFTTRNPLLINLIQEKNWIASQPACVKVYTILKTNQLKLIENSDREEVKYLLKSLKDQDPEVASHAKQGFKEIRIINQYSMDYLCQEWLLKERDKFLESIIVKHKYQAVFPVRVKILTALKTNELSLIENEGKEGIKILLECLKDQDPHIASCAKQSLEEIRIINQDGIDYLCQEWLLKERDPFLESIIIKHKYQAVSPIKVKILTALKTLQLQSLSNLNLEETIILITTFDDSDQLIANNAQKMGDFLQDPTCKSLVYFITEQWEQYERIDFDQNLLKIVFNNGDSSLRKKISEKIKMSGRCDWLEVIFAERKRHNIELMTDYDWQVTVELLNKTDNDQEKWKLAQQAPPFYGQQLLKQIQCLDFIKGEKSVEQNLLHLGKKVIPNRSDLTPWINNNSETVNIGRNRHTHYITSLVMNREGTLLASGDGDRTIESWELPSGRRLNTLLTGHTDWMTSLVMNREGTLLASGSWDNTIKLWKLPSGQLLKTLNGHTDWIRSIVMNRIYSLVMNREGTLLASGSDDGTIKLWELPSGQLLHTLTGHNSIYSLVMNREGTLLASGSYNIQLWELPSGRLLHTLTGHTKEIKSLVMNREGTLLASGSLDKNIKLWELPSGRLLHTITGHTGGISCLAMNREGTLLASASSSSDTSIKIWELPSGRLLHTLTGHNHSIESLVMNREGTLLASASYGIKLWKLYSLDRLPLSKIVNYYDYIQDTLKRNDLNENQRNWFEFMLALVNNYRSFEIDIEDAPIVAEAGEFDIEIED